MNFCQWKTSEIIAFFILINAVIGTVILLYNSFLKNRFINKKIHRFTLDYIGKSEIKKILKNYIKPDCCSLDPSYVDEMREVVLAREPIIKKIRKYLKSYKTYKYLLILADSGMGKTSFLLNFMYKNYRNWIKREDIYFLPLSIKNIDEKLEEIESPVNKVLFFDAFDEDIEALFNDYEKRLLDIAEKSKQFKKIIITCRSQFFENEKVIPKETGVINIKPRTLGESGKYVFGRLHIAPFTDKQVKKYLNKKFFFFQIRKKRKAMKIVKYIPYLSIRPMVLSHIGEFLDEYVLSIYQKDLYNKIISSWIERESHWYKDSKDLLEFSEKLSLKLIFEKKYRGGEYISYNELKPVAQKWGIDLDLWQISGKSLLNRNETSFKFAHRSILEYLFVRSYLKLDINKRFHLRWTDQMKIFLKEIIIDEKLPDLSFTDCRRLLFRNVDFSSINVSYANFENSIFYNCNLSNSNFRGANFTNAKMEKCNLENAIFSQACFNNALIEDTSLIGSDFGGGIFTKSKFKKVNFMNSRFNYSYFENAIIEEGIEYSKIEYLNKALIQGYIKANRVVDSHWAKS